MNILMTHYAFHPTTGGVESHLLDLASALVEQGHDVIALVGSAAGQPAESVVNGVIVHRTDLLDPMHLRTLKASRGLGSDQLDPILLNDILRMYRRYVREFRIDVVHGHNFHHFLPEHATALTRLHDEGMPNVLTVHEVWEEFLCEDLFRNTRWDGIITFCDHVTRGVKAQAPHLDNVVKVVPGIDTRLFAPGAGDGRLADRLGLRHRPVVIHPARMLPWKGVLVSLRAMQRVVERFPSAVLLITDTEDIIDWAQELQGYKQQVLQAIHQMGLSDNVIAQPFAYGDLPGVYAHCDVVIYPTIGEEPFGLVPVEAMACGRPVVVTRSGGMVESVIDGKTGFIIDKDDPEMLAERIIALLSLEQLSSQMGHAARAHAVAHFDRKVMAMRTADVYAMAIGAGELRRTATRQVTAG